MSVGSIADFDKNSVTPYPNVFMSASKILHPTEFARSKSSATGSIPVKELNRLADQLVRNDGNVEFDLLGELTNKGHESITLRVRTQLWLRCQRCLEAVLVPLDSKRRLVFAPDPHQLERHYEDEDTDLVDSLETIDVLELIEDEILLSLPVSPRHAEGECEQIMPSSPNDEDHRPFAVLSMLKRPASGSD
jgi:uncharacterized protein